MLEHYRIAGRTAQTIAQSIEAGIASGALRPGDALPSVRELATRLGVSPATVAAAMRELRNRGSVITRARSRSYVAWRPAVPAPPPVLPTPEAGQDLASGNPDPKLLPNLARVLRHIKPPQQHYGGVAVLPELERLGRARLVDDGVKVEALTVTSGALDAIERALAVQLRPGDAVAVEDPGYAALYDLIRAHGLGLTPLPVDDEGPEPAGLERALRAGVRAVVITPRGQNPTGAALSARRATLLGTLLDRHPDVLVIEDDHLGEVSGAPRFTTLSAPRRGIAIRSVGKSLGPDLRLAIVGGEADLVGQIEVRQRLGPLWVSHLLQQLVCALWEDPRTAGTLERAAEAYRRRRVEMLDAPAARGIQARGASGFHVWVPVADEATATAVLLREGWAAMPGTAYRLSTPPGLRITVSRVETTVADAVADAVVKASSPPRGMTRAA